MATTTTRFGLRKPDPDPFTGDFVDAQADLNDNWDNLDGKLGFIPCTSGTRPGSPFDGMTIRETDTGNAYIYNGTTWKRLMYEEQTSAWPAAIDITRASLTDDILHGWKAGDSTYRFYLQNDGGMGWGNGTTFDTTLYRSAADTLKTDDNFIVGGAFTPSTGFLFKQRVVFTSNGTFSKGSYTGLRAVLVKCVGGGGGSGGCATTGASQGATSGAGAGGNYAEKWILAASLASSETVTVGAGGTAGAAGNNAGGTGGTSSFGTACIATGGPAGGGAAASGSTTGSGGGSGDSTGCVGDLIVTGQDGSDGRHLGTGERINDAVGGASGLGYGYGRSESNVTASAAGLAGNDYGGGASGAHNQASQTQVAGAVGGKGIVIVDVYV